jgi:DNA-binding NtrC family response regulator
LRLAKQLAEDAHLEAEARAAADDARAAYPITPVESPTLHPPLFLHERELTDALKIVTLLASGRNPFHPEPLDRLSAAQQTDVLRSLAVIVCTLASTYERRPAEAVEPYSDGTNPAEKRPLEHYLQRVEKQAILEALEETHHNRTEAARVLGITFRALRYKMESLGITL